MRAPGEKGSLSPPPLRPNASSIDSNDRLTAAARSLKRRRREISLISQAADATLAKREEKTFEGEDDALAL